MIGRQCWDACHLGEADRGVGMMIVLKMHFPYLIGIVIQKKFRSVLVLVRRGCNPNEESPRGITPLICMGR